MPPAKPVIPIKPSTKRTSKTAATNNKWSPSKSKRKDAMVKARVSSEMDSYSGSSGESECGFGQEPIGELLTCLLCTDEFYDPIYLNWHVMHEHGEEVIETLKVRQVKSNFNRSPQKRNGDTQASKTDMTMTSGEKKRQESRRKLFSSDSPKKASHQASTSGMKTQASSSSQSQQISCGRCSKVLSSPWNLQRHMRLHQSKIHCELPSEKKLKTKIAKGRNTSPAYNCPLCEASFYSHGGIIYHVKVRHMDEKYVLECKHCEFGTEDLLDFIKHRFSHEEERIFKCSFCRKSFSSKSGKLHHEKLHGTRKIFDRCPFCKVVFFGAGFLKKHIINKHQN